MESSNKLNPLNLKALIVGATGATGRELTDILIASEFYSEVYLLARRKIDRWDNIEEIYKRKIKILICEDLSILSKDKDEIVTKLSIPKDITSLFCCLGSRTGKGKEEFTRVDYEYVINSASLCEKLQIPYFSLISTKGANKNSFFLYFRVKGQADDECLKKNIPKISIFRPGLIIDRDNDYRLGEKILKYVPFIDKIKSNDLAMKIYYDNINYFQNQQNNTNRNIRDVYSHSDILKLNLNI